MVYKILHFLFQFFSSSSSSFFFYRAFFPSIPMQYERQMRMREIRDELNLRQVQTYKQMKTTFMSFQIFQVSFSFEFQQTWKYQKLARTGHNVEKDALVSGFASSVSFLFQNVSFLRVSSILRVSIYYLYLQIAKPSELEVAWLEQARCGL